MKIKRSGPNESSFTIESEAVFKKDSKIFQIEFDKLRIDDKLIEPTRSECERRVRQGLLYSKYCKKGQFKANKKFVRRSSESLKCRLTNQKEVIS